MIKRIRSHMPLGQRFARVTSSVKFIPQIDGLRALAVLLVIGHHVFAIYLEVTHRLGTESLPRDWALIWNRSALVPWAVNLAFGVSIFFAISGFVLALPFSRSGRDGLPMPSTKLYLLRRLIRLEPPYVLSMTILFALIVFPPHHPSWYYGVMFHVFWKHYVVTLFYLHALIYKGSSWINGVAWTLEIEVQFYLLMPVLALLFKLRAAVTRRVALAGLVLTAALFDQFVLPHLGDPRFGLSLIGHLEFFLAGVLLADIYLDPPRWLTLGPVVYDLAAVLSAAMLVYTNHWNRTLAWTEPFLVLVFFLGVFHGGWTSRLFSLRALTIPGTMCYTIYLYHFVLIQKLTPWTVRLLPPVHSLWVDEVVQMVVLLPVLLGVSAILYLAVERPFIVLSHEATRRWRPRTNEPVAGA